MPINQEKNARALERLVASLHGGRSLALTGAGVSTWAGYGTWGAVINDLASAVQYLDSGVDTAGIIQNNPNPLHCAKRLGEYLGPRFRDFIHAEFGPNGKAPNGILFTLCSLPFRHFLTLNIDCSLEQIHRTLRRPCVSVTTSNPLALTAFMRAHDSDGVARHVLHFHGSYTDSMEHIALTNDGYARLYQDGSLFLRFLWWLVTSQSLVFLGFGFTDSDFLNAIRRAAFDLPQEPVHFAIQGIANTVNDEAIRNSWNDSYRIEPIFYELHDGAENRHARFGELIRGIAAQLAIPEVPKVDLAAEEPIPLISTVAEDLQRADELASELIQKIDPRGDDVPR